VPDIPLFYFIKMALATMSSI